MAGYENSEWYIEFKNTQSIKDTVTMKRAIAHHFLIILLGMVGMTDTVCADTGDRYELVTSAAELKSGDEIIFVNQKNRCTVGPFSSTSKDGKFDACNVELNGNEAVVTKAETTIFVYEVNDNGTFIKTKKDGKYLARKDKSDYGVELLDKVKTSVCNPKLSFVNKTNGRVDIEICSKYYFYCRVVSSTSIIWKAYTSHVESEDCYVGCPVRCTNFSSLS